jgi:hypothetical protein
MNLLSEQAQFYKQILVSFFSKWYFKIKYCSIKYTLFMLSLDIFTQEIVIKTINKHVHASPLPRLVGVSNLEHAPVDLTCVRKGR